MTDRFEFTIDPAAQQIEAELFVRLNSAPAPGESPRFDERKNSLYMVGIDTPVLYSIPLDAEQGSTLEPVGLPKRAGMCALTSDPAVIVLAQEQDLVLYNVETGESCPLVEALEPAELSIRLNDGDTLRFTDEAHPLQGALIVGGISEKSPRAPESGLYAVLPGSLKVVKLLDGIINSNGVGTVGNELVHTDTEKKTVSFYSCETLESEAPLTKIREISFAALGEADSLAGSGVPKPDGLVISQDESVICVACFRAGAVYGVGLEGKHLFTVSVPAPQSAACEIAGDKLFITTGRSDTERFPESGSVFRADLSTISGVSVRGKSRSQFQL